MGNGNIKNMRGIVFSAIVLTLLGAGCSEPAAEVSADDVDLHAGATIAFAQNVSWLRNPFVANDGAELRSATIDAWTAGESAALSWTHSEQQETATSIAAREAAANAPVGSGVVMPDAVYETVTTNGTITTDALDNAERVTLPSYWPEGAYDVRGEENSLVWLSRAQYDELVTTRSSHIALGLFDSTLQNILGFGDTVNAALARLQGNVATDAAASNTDITKLTADPDWGDYTLTLNGTQSMVKTVTASSLFADYTILANAENPLILKVGVKPLSLGLGMLSTLSAINSLAGYHVTAITY